MPALSVEQFNRAIFVAPASTVNAADLKGGVYRPCFSNDSCRNTNHSTREGWLVSISPVALSNLLFPVFA